MGCYRVGKVLDGEGLNWRILSKMYNGGIGSVNIVIFWFFVVQEMVLNKWHFIFWYNGGNILLISDYMSLFTDIGVLNPQLTEEELYIMFVAIMWSKCSFI